MSKKRMPPEVYEAVMDRADDKCEVMDFPGCQIQATQWHHRKLRSQGGGHDVVNGLAVCTHCHNMIHAEPALAYEHGWLVKSMKDPAEMPVKYRGLRSWLHADGGVLWVGNDVE